MRTSLATPQSSAAAMPPIAMPAVASGTIGDLLTQIARQRGNATAYIDSGNRYDWPAVDAASDQLAEFQPGPGYIHAGSGKT